MKLIHKITVILVTISLLQGCGGRAANPVSIMQPGDYEASCNSLMGQMSEIESKIARLIPETNKTGKNVGLGVAGLFLIVPWFFMDLSDSEKVEVESLRSRYNHLLRIYNDKRCGKQLTEIPAFSKQRTK